MGMVPEIMLDITKTGAFLHEIQNIVSGNEHNKKIEANYTLTAKQGTNNLHQARMGMVPEIMLDITISAVFLRATQIFITILSITR